VEVDTKSESKSESQTSCTRRWRIKIFRICWKWRFGCDGT